MPLKCQIKMNLNEMEWKDVRLLLQNKIVRCSLFIKLNPNYIFMRIVSADSVLTFRTKFLIVANCFQYSKPNRLWSFVFPLIESKKKWPSQRNRCCIYTKKLAGKIITFYLYACVYKIFTYDFLRTKCICVRYSVFCLHANFL